MSTRIEILLLIVAFIGLATFPVLIPWIVVRMAADLTEAFPVRPTGRRPAVPGTPSELRAVDPVRERTGPASSDEPIAGSGTTIGPTRRTRRAG